MKLFAIILLIVILSIVLMMFTDKPAIAWLVLSLLIIPLGFMLSEEENLHF